ncbi:MAG TPA: PfkB family carbohydrate kinase, partial [Polyangia bacterium]|nr:PfkB family carbohydrate kinase [Polyangia bacterium]
MNRSQMDPATGRPPETRSLRVIAVAGIDPDGGAGLVRDILTGAALGVAVAAVGTAWTQQQPGRVVVEPRAADAVGEALSEALARHPAAAVKIGMVGRVDVATAIARALETAPGRPVIVDPVLAASGGGALWSGAPADLLPLLRRATLVTPNVVEAAALSGKPVGDPEQAVAAAQVLRGQGVAAVLIKGGHLGDTPATVTDILVDAGGVRRFSRPRVAGPTPRGTGC